MSVRTPVSTRIRVLQISLIVVVSLISFATLTLPIGLRPTSQTVDVGDVAQITLQSPHDVEYVSDIRTEEARKAAESAVQPVYSSPDPAIARQQIERLRVILQNITSVRGSIDTTNDEKKSNILTLSDVRLKLETVDYLINMSDTRWDIVQSESVRVLEQVMRRAIYEDKVDAAQSGISSFVSLTLNEQQSALVTELVTAFVVPNSFFSEELTTAAPRRSASAAGAGQARVRRDATIEERASRQEGSRGQVVALALEGKDAIEVVRKLMGKTNSRQAEPGTIRGDFAISDGYNLVHGSDGEESAAFELSLFFQPGGPSSLSAARARALMCARCFNSASGRFVAATMRVSTRRG